MSSPSKRREMDVMKLMMSDYKVDMVNDSINEFYVEFVGPKDSPYEGGHWKLHVELPDAYPYKSPSIGFVNRIYHPNVDEMAGSVCLDVINQKWSPMFGETSQALRSSHAIRAGDWAIVAPRLGTCLSQRSFPHPADLINVFEVFLPQLLLYPNPTDPLNGEAAAMLMREPEAYKKKVQEYVQRYAKAEDIGGAEAEDDASSLSDASSGGGFSSDEEDAAATADP